MCRRRRPCRPSQFTLMRPPPVRRRSPAWYDLCGASSVPNGWNFTPVGYSSSSSTVSSTDVSNGASSWGSVQSKISLGTSTYPRNPAIYIVDSTTYSSVGYTQIYGGACAPCYGWLDQCSGKCDNAAAVYAANVLLNPTLLSAAASAYSALVDVSAVLSRS